MTTAVAPRSHLKTAIYAACFALGMLGMAYASVPLYRLFCQVTGFGGTTQKAEMAELPAQPLARQMSVRFDGNTNGIAWDFRPLSTTETVRIGEKKLVFYRATNTGSVPVTGTSTFNVTPHSAGKYFSKIQCFCFQEQTLMPGESIDMPVVFFVDPAIVDDADGKRIEEITLSYTFFPVDKAPAPGQGTSFTPTVQMTTPEGVVPARRS